MLERDILSDNASYTMKYTKNNYCQGNVVRYVLSFCRTEWTEKLLLERNFWLNIYIESHIAYLYYLFWYFKNIWPFLLTLISLNKDIFLLSRCQSEKKLVLSEKRHLLHWWHSSSCVVKFWWYHYELYFSAMAMWYSSSTIMTMKAPLP